MTVPNEMKENDLMNQFVSNDDTLFCVTKSVYFLGTYL